MKFRSQQFVAFALFATMAIRGAATLHSAEIDFKSDVLPLLKSRCIDCHGPEEQESGLKLDSPTAALRGGESGEHVIVPGKSDASYLIELVSSDDPDVRMPPDGDALLASELALLRNWINDEKAWQVASNAVAEVKSDHWSLQPVRRPVLQTTKPHSIDALIQRALAKNELAFSPRADRRTLIRRLYLVMHGLPPTPDQVHDFIHDSSDTAWRSLVDRVLSSPRYGERWAVHWLDLVRFGETHGFETNRERPNAWHYRDWVIRALNDDMPYDQFIREQIAGDALGADVATGFLVAGPYDLVKGQDANLRLVQRQDELADMINTTGTAFLGLTLGCARCHNHKFDPISQTDYYSLQAVFAGVQHGDRPLRMTTASRAELAALDKRIAGLKSQLEEFLPERRDGRPAKQPPVNAHHNSESFPPTDARLIRFSIDKTTGGEPCIDELEIFSNDQNVALASNGAKASSGGDFVHPLHKLPHINDGRYGNAKSWIAKQATGGWVQIELPKVTRIDGIEWSRDREQRYSDRLATGYRIEVATEPERWQLLCSSADRVPYGGKIAEPMYDFANQPSEIAARGRALLAELQTTERRREQLSKPTNVYAGTFTQPGPTHRLYRGEPTAPREKVAPNTIAALGSLPLKATSPEQQRRLELAKWIADRDNPLTARVHVNRLWQFHFGAGIVDTPSDFGANGTPPSHPELLDYLAAEFIDSGWSIKHIHRLILLSRTWQQDSRPNRAAMSRDSSSRLLWRFPPRRLEAEAIRDCMLAASGVLDPRMGGPGFSAFKIEPENVRHYFPKQNYGPDDWRRMVYMTKVRQERDSVFGVFDCPDASQVVPKRSRSTTPLQALNLLNSRFTMQQASLFADRLTTECGEQIDNQILGAYQLCFGRAPDDGERKTAAAFIDAHGLTQFTRAMLNANEFVFIP